MATKLKNIHLTSVDLVRSGANQEADICLFKGADHTGATQRTTEAEKSIFKRFIGWLRENHTEDEYEPTDPIEKTDDIAKTYADTFSESIQSIHADETLGGIEKIDMMCKSIGEFYEAIGSLDHQDRPEEDESACVEKTADIDEIEEI